MNQDYLLFALMQKVTKRSRQTRMLRRFADPRTTVTPLLFLNVSHFNLLLKNDNSLLFWPNMRCEAMKI